MTLAFTPPVARVGAQWRPAIMPLIELGVLAVAVAVAVGSYFIIAGEESPQRLLTPPLVALLLVANLAPWVAILVLIGRRVAYRRAARSPIGGTGRLHVRLVALFSVMATVPMLFLTIFASLLFQYGVEFWYSDKVRNILENATALARTSYSEMLNRWDQETVTMAADLAGVLRETTMDNPRFSEYFGKQVFYRNLSEAGIFTLSRDGTVQTLALVNPYERDLSTTLTPRIIAQLRSGQPSVVTDAGDRIEVMTLLPGSKALYLYGGRISDGQAMGSQAKRAEAVLTSYRALLKRSRNLQLRFNAALLGLSLFIVGIAVWIALAVADRLVRPVGELVAAARAVERGDLTARVAAPRRQDEVGTLANAFNAMTGRLQQQTGALVAANDQLSNRRALMEAVLSGVSAGVISVGQQREIRLMNSSAMTLLGAGEETPVGRPLREVSPELDALIDGDRRETVVQVVARGETRTLAVKIARAGAGPVLTFDDITQQLLDQRRAAWADVARRIAHEIKNPLTPIQLAAERLQRRYGRQFDSEEGTFARLTETIVRQVGDLRRMVDEFSAFARMPKPVFHRESLVDLAKQTLFLHEVAHPNIRFELIQPDPPPTLVCDRRQIGQALTNIVKNAVEAIDACGQDCTGTVTMTLHQTPERVTIEVADTGIGLPVERDRIVEPYMTTRARGTGLGLAIVTRIAEEHFGTIAFADREGGGTVVTLSFDASLLDTLDQGDAEPDAPLDERPSALTRNRTS